MGTFDPSTVFQATAVRPIGPLEAQAKVAQLRALQNGNQLDQMRIAELKRQQDEQARIRAAAQGAVGPQQGSYTVPGITLGDTQLPDRTVNTVTPGNKVFDRQKFLNNLMQSAPLAAQGFQAQDAAVQQEQQKQQALMAKVLTEADTAHLANIHAHESMISDSLAPLLQMSEEQRAQLYPKIAGQLLQRGIADPQALSAQYQGPEALTQLVKRVIGAKTLAEQEIQKRKEDQAQNYQNQQLGSKTVETDKGVMQYNPATGAYDKRVGGLKPNASPHAGHGGGGASLLTGTALTTAAQNYRTTGQIPPGFTRSPDTVAAIIGEAARLEGVDKGDPNASPDVAQNKLDYTQRKALETEYFGRGKTFQNIRSLNTAVGHLGRLYDAADALQNGNIKVLNNIANQFGVQTGSSAPVVFDAIKTAATGELGSTFKGSAATDPEIANLSATLNKDLSGKVNKDVIREDMHLLGSRLYAIDEQYAQDAGKRAPKGKILFGNSQSVFDRAGVKLSEYQNQPNATPTPQVSNIHVNPQTGEKIGWDGKQWVRVQ